MVCPKCNSTDLKKLSLIHAAGVYESRGSLVGALIGSGDGLLFGRYSGKSQSRLSKIAVPPRKMPFAAPIVLWLLGFFILMAFDARGKLSWITGELSIAYPILLPAYLLGAFLYNLLVRRKEYSSWEQKFMCQRCGATTTI